jgi:hypothetical protein
MLSHLNVVLDEYLTAAYCILYFYFVLAHDLFNLVLQRLEVLLVLMGDCKDALKYLELLEIATLRRFTDANLLADKINLVFYLCIWKTCTVQVSLML